MAPRTVLYLHSSAERYGADRQLALIVSGLDPVRYRARVVLPFGGPLEEDLRAAGADVVIRPLAVLRRELLTPGGLAGLARALAADARALPRAGDGAAIVHSNTSVVLGGPVAARRLGVPHVSHVREIYAAAGPLWPAWREAMARTGTLVSISEAVRAQFGGRGRVLADGVSAPPCAPGREAARRALDLAHDAWVVALPGRLSAWKGQDVLIDAVARLPGAVALLAGGPWRGDPGREDALRRRAAAAGVAGRVRFLGFRDDIGTVLAAADAVAVPSTRPEPLGNAALEAALAGRPVVAAAHGGLTEIFAGERTGLLVAPGDADVLAAALGRLRADPALGERLAAAARAELAQRFAPQRLIAEVQDLYDELLAGPMR